MVSSVVLIASSIGLLLMLMFMHVCCGHRIWLVMATISNFSLMRFFRGWLSGRIALLIDTILVWRCVYYIARTWTNRGHRSALRTSLCSALLLKCLFFVNFSRFASVSAIDGFLLGVVQSSEASAQPDLVTGIDSSCSGHCYLDVSASPGP